MLNICWSPNHLLRTQHFASLSIIYFVLLPKFVRRPFELIMTGCLPMGFFRRRFNRKSGRSDGDDALFVSSSFFVLPFLCFLSFVVDVVDDALFTISARNFGSRWFDTTTPCIMDSSSTSSLLLLQYSELLIRSMAINAASRVKKERNAYPRQQRSSFVRRLIIVVPYPAHPRLLPPRPPSSSSATPATILREPSDFVEPRPPEQ